MRPYVVTAVICACLGTSVSASPAPRRRTAATDVLAAYEEQMSEIMEEMDANEDGMLDLDEFDGMMERLDISDAELDDLCKCTTESLIIDYDMDNDGKLTETELLFLAGDNPKIGPSLIMALQNMPTPETEDRVIEAVTNPAPEILEATAKACAPLTYAPVACAPLTAALDLWAAQQPWPARSRHISCVSDRVSRYFGRASAGWGAA